MRGAGDRTAGVSTPVREASLQLPPKRRRGRTTQNADEGGVCAEYADAGEDDGGA